MIIKGRVVIILTVGGMFDNLIAAYSPFYLTHEQLFEQVKRK